jgi:hypothetical protein
MFLQKIFTQPTVPVYTIGEIGEMKDREGKTKKNRYILKRFRSPRTRSVCGNSVLLMRYRG